MSAIRRFTPKQIPPDEWDLIAPLARQVVAASEGLTPYGATQRMTIVSSFLWWCLRIGLDLSEELFEPDQIDSYIAKGLGDRTSGTRANQQSQLKAIGRTVLGYPTYPAPALKLEQSDPVGPYADRDLAALWAFTRGLSSARSYNARALIALGAGAGLKAHQISALVGTDFVRRADGLFVSLPASVGDRAVPFRREWEEEAWVLSQRAGERPVFRPDRSGVNRKDISRFIEDLPVSRAVPRLRVERLRVTWIVRQLEVGVRLDVIAAAAGVTAEQIAKYARYMSPPAETMAFRSLRGPQQ